MTEFLSNDYQKPIFLQVFEKDLLFMKINGVLVKKDYQKEIQNKIKFLLSDRQKLLEIIKLETGLKFSDE